MGPIAKIVANSAQRFDVLDALRGICALLVALYHFQSNGYISSLPIVKNGWLFVDYFFVLSGFVIAHSYGERLANGDVSIGRFIGLRLGRIYPLHLVVLLGFIALEIVLIVGGDLVAGFVSREAFTGSREVQPLIQNLFLVQSFGFGDGRGWNVPAWSISAEMWTYLLFAFIFLANRRVMLVIAAIIALASFVWIAANSSDLHITFNGGILRCVFGFSIGVLTYHAFIRFGGIGGSAWELLTLTATMVLVSIATSHLTYVVPLFFAATIFVLASQRGVISKALKAKPLQLLGLASYSIYMIHMFVQSRLAEFLQVLNMADVSVDDKGRTFLQGSPIADDAITIAMLALVIAGSVATYNLVEKPGRELSRKLFLQQS